MIFHPRAVVWDGRKRIGICADCRQDDGDLGSLSKLAFELKGTLEGLDDVQHNAQSESRAARGGCRIASGVASEESIPDLLLIVFGDTDAGIFDHQSAC